MKKKIVAMLLLTFAIGITGCASSNVNSGEGTAIAKERTAEREKETKAAERAEKKTDETKEEEQDKTADKKDTKEEAKEAVKEENNKSGNEEKENKETEKEVVEKEESEKTATEKEETGKEDGDERIEDIFKNENKQSVHGATVIFNLDGCKFTIPEDYYCIYAEGIGPVVSMENVFQMRLGARGTAYSECLKDLPSNCQKAKDAGATILEEPKEVKINGNSYIYFVMELDWDKCVVVLSDSPDHKSHLGGQIVVESEQVDIMDIVRMYASIAEKVTMTDEPDSTAEEIEEQAVYIVGEKREYTEMSFAGRSVTAKVQDGCYYTHESTGEYDSVQFFTSAQSDMWLCLEKNEYNGAEDIARIAVQSSENAKGEEYEIGGRKVYAVINSYEFNGAVYNEMDCYCDMGNDIIYSVHASNCDGCALTFDMVKTFFEIKD